MSYDYIKRAYGIDFKPGMKVTCDELHGIEGTVLRVRGDPQYVRIRYPLTSIKMRDGDFHPTSVTVKP